MTTPSQPEPLDTELDELVSKIFMAGYQSGKKSGLTMVIASDVIEPEAKSRLKKIIARENDTSKVTRFEVIDHTKTGTGRAFVKYEVELELSFQDDNRTLKVFLKDKLQKENES